MLKVTVLGCGSSLGVPMIGCDCNICQSDSNFNKRSCSAIIIENQATRILVDFGFSIRDQLIREKIRHIDAAILTHDHADHVAGMDNLRIFSHITGVPLPIYVEESIFGAIEERFKYLFTSKQLELRTFNINGRLRINDMDIQFFPQYHGEVNSAGIRVENFVYSTDVASFPEEAEGHLYNIKTWFLDCIDHLSNNSHAGLDRILEWDKKFAPEQIFLTNMHHNIDYNKIILELPKHIKPLYDGFKIVI